MDTYNCLQTKEFIEDFVRMCNSYGNCEECPIDKGCKFSCPGLTMDVLSIADIETVQEWANNHPEAYLTEEEFAFFRAFVKTENRYIERSFNGNLYCVLGDNYYQNFEIDKEFFSFIKKGQMMRFEDLFELGVK